MTLPHYVQNFFIKLEDSEKKQYMNIFPSNLAVNSQGTSKVRNDFYNVSQTCLFHYLLDSPEIEFFIIFISVFTMQYSYSPESPELIILSINVLHLQNFCHKIIDLHTCTLSLHYLGLCFVRFTLITRVLYTTCFTGRCGE